MEKSRKTKIKVVKSYADGRVVHYGKKKVSKSLYKNPYVNNLFSIKKSSRVSSLDSESLFNSSRCSIYQSESSNFNSATTAELFQVRNQPAHLETTKRENKRKFDHRLKNFPFNFTIFVTVILIISSIAQMALQIVLLVHKAPLNTVAAGTWSGAYGILLTIINIILIVTKKYSFYVTSFIMSIIGIFIYIALSIINSLCLSLYDLCQSCGYNSNLLGINITLMVLGVVSFSVCVLYIFRVLTDMN